MLNSCESKNIPELSSFPKTTQNNYQNRSLKMKIGKIIKNKIRIELELE